MTDATRYVEVCTDLVNGVCNATAWVPFPGESIYTIEEALLISGAIAGLWAAAWLFRPLASAIGPSYR